MALQGSLVKHQVWVRRDGRGLDKNYIPAFAHFPGFWMVDAKGRDVRAVSDEASFPSASIQLLGEGFYMDKRPGSDSPKVFKVSWLAVEGLEGRLVAQSCVRSSVAQVRCRKEEFSPQKRTVGPSRRASSEPYPLEYGQDAR